MHAQRPDLLLTTSEAAELLEVHPSTVKRWTDEEALESEKTPGGHRRIRLGTVLHRARDREIPTYLHNFSPFESDVWLAVRDGERRGDFNRAVSLAYEWLRKGRVRAISALTYRLGRRETLTLGQLFDGFIRPLHALVRASDREAGNGRGLELLVTQALMEGMLRLSADISDRPTGPGTVTADAPIALVTSMPGDSRTLGSMGIRLILEQGGWTVLFLNEGVPAAELAALQRTHGAQMVCVSASSMASALVIGEFLKTFRREYDGTLPFGLVVRGEELTPGAVASLNGTFNSAHPFSALQELEAWVGIATVGERDGEWIRSA